MIEKRAKKKKRAKPNLSRNGSFCPSSEPSLLRRCCCSGRRRRLSGNRRPLPIRQKPRISDLNERNDAVSRGSGPADRASDGVQASAGSRCEGAVRSGESDSRGGVERSAGEVPRHHLRRHSRPVLRSHRALSDRRKRSRY